jgi:hypothetical protein
VKGHGTIMELVNQPVVIDNVSVEGGIDCCCIIVCEVEK